MADDIVLNPVPDIDWYRDIVAGAPDLIDIVSRDGSILYSNAFGKAPGTTVQLGTPIYDYFFKEFHELVREKIDRVFETGVEDFYELATDYRTNTVQWYMTRVGPIIRDEKVVAVSLFIRNITRMKEEEAALNQMNEALEERVQSRTAELQAYANRLEASEEVEHSPAKSGQAHGCHENSGRAFAFNPGSRPGGHLRI